MWILFVIMPYHSHSRERSELSHACESLSAEWTGQVSNIADRIQPSPGLYLTGGLWEEPSHITCSPKQQGYNLLPDIIINNTPFYS